MQGAKHWIRDLAVYEPGKPIEETARELGFDPEEVHKLASNENAIGPSPLAVIAMQSMAAKMHRYPDGGGYYLRRELARHLDVPAEGIVLGNGSNELIELLSHVFVGPGTEVVMSDRAFIVYKLTAAAYQGEAVVVPMKGYTHDLEAMLAAVTPRTRLVYISNPNNPTGTMVAPEAVERFMAAVPDDIAVVFDEAYVELAAPERCPDVLRYVREGRSVFILRTFSKAYGLAGLRIGYAVTTAAGAELLNRVRQPFNVNAMAQVAALAALADEAHLRRTRGMLVRGREYLMTEFTRMGLNFVPSEANFMLVETGNGRKVFQDLQSKRIIVRPMDGYGMPEMIRITIGTDEENRSVVRALEELLKQEGMGYS